MDILALVSAFGVGAIITAALQAWMTSKTETKKRNFQEKKECYIGLIEAYRNAVKRVPNYKDEYAYWAVRCSLVAPKKVRELIEAMKTNDVLAQETCFEKLQHEMRKDLGVTND